MERCNNNLCQCISVPCKLLFFFFLEQNTSTLEVMDTEGVFAEESEVDLTKETAVEEAVRTVDSEDEEDVQDDGGTLSSDDEDFIVGK